MKAACARCPFRVGSTHYYDPDALEALHDGCVPSCHKLAGLDAVFSDPNPTAKRCRGHDAWVSGRDGFSEPQKVMDKS